MDADFSTPGYNPGRGFPYGDGEGDGERSGSDNVAVAAPSSSSSSSSSSSASASAASASSSAAASRIPFARPDDPRNAHFASLVCKAVYEDSAVVADLVRERAGVFFFLTFLFCFREREVER